MSKLFALLLVITALGCMSPPEHPRAIDLPTRPQRQAFEELHRITRQE